MNDDKTVFSQIMNFFPKYEFGKKVSKYKGNYNVRNFSCWDQFLCMSFAQLTYRSSLRDIEACLNAQPSKLYHMGIQGHVSRTNLANANRTRDWKIYAEFAQHLMSKARNLYQNDKLENLDLGGVIYALDSTTIDLCLSLFPLEKGEIYVIRFIKSDLNFNIFGLSFILPEETKYEYIKGVIITNENRLIIFKDQKYVTEFQFFLYK